MDNENQKILRLVEVADEVFDDIEVRHPAHLVSHVPEDAPMAVVLGNARTRCLPLAQEICTSLCMDCDHFIGSQRMADGSLVLRCWTHRARPRLARGTGIVKIADPKMH